MVDNLICPTGKSEPSAWVKGLNLTLECNRGLEADNRKGSRSLTWGDLLLGVYFGIHLFTQDGGWTAVDPVARG